MKEAAESLFPNRVRLHVSVAREPKWEKSGSGGDEVCVRWICWSIEDGEQELLPPEFDVVSPQVTEAQLSKELPPLFPDLKVLVDDDIDV